MILLDLITESKRSIAALIHQVSTVEQLETIYALLPETSRLNSELADRWEMALVISPPDWAQAQLHRKPMLKPKGYRLAFLSILIWVSFSFCRRNRFRRHSQRRSRSLRSPAPRGARRRIPPIPPIPPINHRSPGHQLHLLFRRHRHRHKPPTSAARNQVSPTTMASTGSANTPSPGAHRRSPTIPSRHTASSGASVPAHAPTPTAPARISRSPSP